MNKIVIIMDLLEIWATWIFDRYEKVKESLTYTFHFLFTQLCDASDGNYFLASGKQFPWIRRCRGVRFGFGKVERLCGWYAALKT